MDIDFALVLVIAVAVTGVVYAYDAFLLAPKRKAALQTAEGSGVGLSDSAKEKITQQPILVEYSRSFFPVLLIVLLLRSFLVEPFQIPSGSMLPTLKVGDFILVNKFHYGIRLPVIGTKVISINEPQRGDVMVFKYPKNPKINYIKRVIGLPGDRIRYVNKTLYINDEKMSQEFQANLNFDTPPKNLATEHLGPVEHDIYKNLTLPRAWPEWVVPEGSYFMMGDNRDNSNDSRYWGFVPDDLIVGKAFAVWLHWESWLSLPSFKNNGLIN